MNESFGKRLQATRKQKNITQQNIADNLNVVKQTVSAWESNKNVPDIYTAKKIADFLEVPLAYLTGEINVPEFPKENEIPTFLRERLSKLDSLKSDNLPDKLEEIAKELLEVSKKLKSL